AGGPDRERRVGARRLKQPRDRVGDRPQVAAAVQVTQQRETFGDLRKRWRHVFGDGPERMQTSDALVPGQKRGVGRVYFTIVTNLEAGHVVWIGDGKGRKGLLRFLR